MLLRTLLRMLEQRETIGSDDAEVTYNLSQQDRAKFIRRIKQSKRDFGLRAFSRAAGISHHRISEAVGGDYVSDSLLIRLRDAANTLTSTTRIEKADHAQMLEYLARRVADQGRNRVARILGIDPTNLGKILNGKRGLSARLVKRIEASTRATGSWS